MHPLIQPPIDYASVGPWRVSFEWADGRFASVGYPDLPHAIFAFWDSLDRYGPFGAEGAPNRRVLIDARGVTVLGALDQVDTELPVIATQEIINMQESIGCDPIDLLSLEMEIRWNIATM